jgi:hypothetical protein
MNFKKAARASFGKRGNAFYPDSLRAKQVQ